MSFLKRWFKKENVERSIPPMPSWDAIVEQLYDKDLETVDHEVVRVYYANDRAKRYVILKDKKGLLTYHLEFIEPFDEDEWQYMCFREDVLPAMWVGTGNFHSVFENEEELMRDLQEEAAYKQYFL